MKIICKFIIFLFAFSYLISCSPKEKPPVYGCTDPNSYYYNPYANVNDGSCKYLGLISLYRKSTGVNNDSIEFWLDTINGKGLKLRGTFQYNELPTKPQSCTDINTLNIEIPIGTWIYQLRKKSVGSPTTNLTPVTTVKSYNKLCDTLGLN